MFVTMDGQLSKFKKLKNITLAGTCHRMVSFCFGMSLAAPFFYSYEAQADLVRFQSYSTHSHLNVALDPSISYEIKENYKNGKIESLNIILRGYKESSVSALIDENSFKKDLRTQDIKALSNNSANGFQITFKPKAVDAGVEYFDYRTSKDSELVLDFWTKKPLASEK